MRAPGAVARAGAGPLLGLLLAGVAVASFWPFGHKLMLRWGSGDDSYAWLVVPVVGYLLWARSRDFAFGRVAWSGWGLAAALGAVGLVAVGELGSMETLAFAGLWLAAVAVAVTLYGGRVRALAFPFAVLLFTIPLPPFVNRVLTFRLRLLASDLAARALRLFDVAVYREGNILDLGSSQLQVVDACSGLRYLMPLFLLALLIGHLTLGGWGRKAVLVALVLPVSVAMNSVRIVGMGLFAVHGYPGIADGLGHDLAGWGLFMAGGAVLVGVASRLREKPDQPPITNHESRLPHHESRITSHESRLRGPLVAGAVALIFTGGAWGVGRLPGLATAPTRAEFASFPAVLAGWEGRRNYFSPEIMDSLWADDYVSATFARPGVPNQVYLLVPFYAYQATRHTAHAPQSCLLGGGWTQSGARDLAVPLADGGVLTVRVLRMHKAGSTLLASYFFLQRGRVIRSPWAHKAYLAWDAVARRRTDGALVRAEITVAPGQAEAEAEELLAEFLRELWGVLPAYVPG